MNILVTGGLGVNGAWVTRRLLGRGHTPVVYENRHDLSLLSDLAGQLDVVLGDVTDVASLVRVLLQRRVSRVVHMAALMPPQAQADPLNGFRVNAMGTVQVLEAARIAGVERVVFTSSRAVYGAIPPGENGHPTYRPVPEDYPCRPLGVYDVSKLASEGMGANYQRNYGIQFVALRFAQIYGPGKIERHGYLSIHSKIIENSLAGCPVRILQGRDQKDDLIYVDDIAEAIVLATVNDSVTYPVYNIASGEARSLEEFADAVRRVIPGADISIGPGLDFLNAGASRYAAFDTARARDDLGFTARYTYEAGVRHYAETLDRLGIRPIVSA